MGQRISWSRRVLGALLVMGCLVLAAGCAGQTSGLEGALPVITARYASKGITVDGRLDEPVWREAAVYPMVLSEDDALAGKTLAEAGEVRFAWDDKNLYLAVRFADSDVMADGAKDQLEHYTLGDVAELFIKPEEQTWYWELYVTPSGRKSSVWYPGRGRIGAPSCFEYTCGLTVAARCDGTLNDWRDRDNGWTAEMAMPIKDLTARGERFAPGAKWRVCVGRYNFSRYLPWKELSMAPALLVTRYHRYEEFAVLDIVR